MSSILKWVAALGFGLLSGPLTAQTTVEYIHTDALGSVVAVTNEAGQVVERNEYEPYGFDLMGIKDGPGYTGHVSDATTGLSYMQQRYYDPGIGRFLSVDPVTAYAMPGSNFNRYWYANNNPYKFTDPDGRLADVFVDIGFIGYSTYKLATEPSWTNAAALGADIVGAAVPFATGLGTAVRATAHGADAAKAASNVVENGARGRASEKRVLADMGETKNTDVVRGGEKPTIPDFQNPGQVGEIKDTARVSDSAQLRSQREHAQATGREHVVVTGTNTRVSETVQTQSTVIRRDDLGPREK